MPIESGWTRISEGVTDEDGRVKGLHGEQPMTIGHTYKLTFHTAQYFEDKGIQSFYPKVEVQLLSVLIENIIMCPLLNPSDIQPIEAVNLCDSDSICHKARWLRGRKVVNVSNSG